VQARGRVRRIAENFLEAEAYLRFQNEAYHRFQNIVRVELRDKLQRFLGDGDADFSCELSNVVNVRAFLNTAEPHHAQFHCK